MWLNSQTLASSLRPSNVRFIVWKKHSVIGRSRQTTRQRCMYYSKTLLMSNCIFRVVMVVKEYHHKASKVAIAVTVSNCMFFFFFVVLLNYLFIWLGFFLPIWNKSWRCLFNLHCLPKCLWTPEDNIHMSIWNIPLFGEGFSLAFGVWLGGRGSWPQGH